METPRPGQEKLAAALSSAFFFVPLLMDIRTPFVVKYMKQGFIINVVELVLALVSPILWMMMGLFALLNFVCVITSLWLAFQAFSDKDYSIPVLLQNADKLIHKLGIGKWFSIK